MLLPLSPCFISIGQYFSHLDCYLHCSLSLIQRCTVLVTLFIFNVLFSSSLLLSPTGFYFSYFNPFSTNRRRRTVGEEHDGLPLRKPHLCRCCEGSTVTHLYSVTSPSFTASTHLKCLLLLKSICVSDVCYAEIDVGFIYSLNLCVFRVK
ncbi:unnamed protein product [Brassica oleracea]